MPVQVFKKKKNGDLAVQTTGSEDGSVILILLRMRYVESI
jgi:hypothetical protein